MGISISYNFVFILALGKVFIYEVEVITDLFHVMC